MVVQRKKADGTWEVVAPEAMIRDETHTALSGPLAQNKKSRIDYTTVPADGDTIRVTIIGYAGQSSTGTILFQKEYIYVAP